MVGVAYGSNLVPITAQQIQGRFSVVWYGSRSRYDIDTLMYDGGKRTFSLYFIKYDEQYAQITSLRQTR